MPPLTSKVKGGMLRSCISSKMETYRPWGHLPRVPEKKECTCLIAPFPPSYSASHVKCSAGNWVELTSFDWK